MRACATILWVLLAAGCGGRSVSSAENQNNGNTTTPDGSVPMDAGDRPDGGTTPCDVDDAWQLMATPLSSITVLNPALGGNGIPQGVTVRVEVEVDYTGCDQMAGVQFDIFPQDLLVLLTGYVWRYEGSADCPHGLQTGVERIALPELTAGDWELLDSLINSPGVPFWVRPCTAAEDCTCDSWQGVPGDWGATCEYDCMCAPELGCVMDGSGGCYQTCSVTSDCPLPLFCNDFLPQTSTGVCLSTGLLESCTSDADCAAGYACLAEPELGLVCLAAMDPDHRGTPCVVDCDCAQGFACVTLRPGEPPSCQIKCRGNRDCPRTTTCDDPGSPQGFNRLVCQ